MKLTSLILFLLPATLLGSGPGPSANLHLLQNQVIDELVVKQAPLDQVIDLIREKTKVGEAQVNFIIPAATNPSARRVTLDLRGVNAMDVFATVLSMTDTRAELRHNMVFILPKPKESQ